MATPGVPLDSESHPQGSVLLCDVLEPVTVRVDAWGTLEPDAVQGGHTVQESTEHSLCCLENTC